VPLFPRRAAIYVLCFSLERMASVDEEERAGAIAQVEFWLESVATYADAGGSKANVLLVGTHKDKVDLKGQEAANELLSRELGGRPAFARQVVRNHKAEGPSGLASWCFFAVNNRIGGQDPMVVALREAVLKLALEDPVIRMQVPLPWLRVVDEVKAGDELVLTRGEVEALCRKCGVQRGQEGGVLRFMHERGFVLNLPYGQLKNFAVSKPINFLIHPLTRLIRQQSIHGADDIPGATAHPDWQLFVEEAIATDSLLEVLWYDRREHLELLLTVAVKYGLLVPLSGQGEGFSERGGSKRGGDEDDNGEYLVPTVLRREEPQAPEGEVSTFFLAFAGREQMKRLRKMPGLTLRQYRRTAFLSYGIFCHVLGACVHHSQAVSRRYEMRLSANEAKLRIGGCLVMMQFERAIAAVRLSVFAQTTAGRRAARSQNPPAGALCSPLGLPRPLWRGLALRPATRRDLAHPDCEFPPPRSRGGLEHGWGDCVAGAASHGSRPRVRSPCPERWRDGGLFSLPRLRWPPLLLGRAGGGGCRCRRQAGHRCGWGGVSCRRRGLQALCRLAPFHRQPQQLRRFHLVRPPCTERVCALPCVRWLCLVG